MSADLAFIAVAGFAAGAFGVCAWLHWRRRRLERDFDAALQRELEGVMTPEERRKAWGDSDALL